jgi:hypothetical protein
MSFTTLAAAALFLVLAAGTAAHWLGGAAAVAPALACAGLAAATQLGAARLARRALDARFTQFLGAWALGVGLRFVGVALLAVATLVAPAHFPPLPSTFGFLGVLIPLLLLEIRLTR